MTQAAADDQATLILVRGLPGSGKTYLAARLQAALGQPLVLLDPDATDYDSEEYANHVKAQTAEGVDPTLHAYRFLRAQAWRAIAEHRTIVWNQPFTNLEIFNKMTAGLKAYAAERNVRLRILVVEVQIDPAAAHARVEARKQAGGHGPSEATFNRFVNDYTSFAAHGYKTVTVDGAANVETSVAAIKKALEKL